jgi:hypothetical protein
MTTAPPPARAGPAWEASIVILPAAWRVGIITGEGASSVTEILTEPVSAPNVWRGGDLADTSGWIIRFAEEDFADFERALAHVSKKHLTGVTDIRAADFPLPHFQERIDDIVDRLEHGLGLVLLRGLPIYERFSADQATTIYWGMGQLALEDGGERPAVTRVL